MKNIPHCCHSCCHEESGVQRRLCWWGIEAQDPDNSAPILAKSEDFESYQATNFPWGDLIIQRYDRSDWRVRLIQCSHSLKGVRQVRGLGRVVERGEEAMTSLEGLSYPKAKRRSKRRWTRNIVKGAEEVENADANSKYQDKAEGQRPKNCIRPMSTSFSSR
ncbi:hypothetical protein BHE74_00033419 [Ensete ventricosum]|nr:hypothetical protein BHE74_00033419 [Ensete ventricosum]